MGMETKRINWIDCSKAVAIIAVAVDHCHNLLYSSDTLQQASFFSVSVFVLLSGVSTGVTSKYKDRDYIYQLKKIGKLFKDYAIATGVYLIFAEHFFDLKTYITYLLNFNIKELFYFLLFFFQLLLVSPFLVKCCKFFSKFNRGIWQGLVVVGIFILSILCIQITFILPVHGGGKYLFGGTYLFLYYLGILFGWYNIFDKSRKIKYIMLLLFGGLWIVWFFLDVYSIIPLDKMFEQFIGIGVNPPGIQLILFSVITMFFLYSLFSLLEEEKTKLGKIVVNIFSLLGKYTLYVYMYHLLVRDFILEKITHITSNIWMLRVFVFVPMVFLPMLVVHLLRSCKNYVIRINKCEG